MNLSEHFSLAEFTRSDTARRLGLDNSMPDDLLGNARRTCLMLERIRAHLCRLVGVDVSMHITSGYRHPVVSAAIGSSGASDHTIGIAADWVAPMAGRPYVIARELSGHIDELGIGQLINEFPGADGDGWIHTSTEPPARAINRVITIDRNLLGRIETRVGVLESFA